MSESTGRRERKRQQTADKLAETAWRLFEAQGFEQVTMEAVAEAADVAKGTLYKHFPVKEALLMHQVHKQMQQERPKILARLEPVSGTRERLRAFFSIAVDWSERYRDYLPHYLNYRMSSAGGGSRSGTDRIFTWLIESGVKSGELRNELVVDTAVHYLSFLYLGVLLRWLKTPGLSLGDEFERMLTLFLDGMGVR